MTIDIKSLNEKALQVLHNSDEFVRKWNEFLAAPAGNVSLEYYDENGNLQTATFSNRNKLVQDFIANVNSVMSKTFYVDSINGDDNNDGSSAAPFATPEKAIDSIPIGGKGLIYMRGGSYTIRNRLSLINKTVFIYCNDSQVDISFDTYDSGGRERPYLFDMRNSQLIIYGYGNCKIMTPTQKTTSSIYNEPTFMSTGMSLVGFWNCDIEINDYMLVGGYNSIGALNFIAAAFSSCNIVKKNNFVASASNMLAITENGNTLTDEQGNTLSWSDVIASIVRDANGTPRNVISNLIL